MRGDSVYSKQGYNTTTIFYLIFIIMKRKFLPLMIFAAAICSCSKDVQSDVSNAQATDDGDLVAINVYAGTSKALDATTLTLQTSAWVELHIDDSGGISETYTFKYTSSDWSQSETDPISWSDITFPANFYSLHDGNPLTGLTFDDDEDDDYAVYKDYTVSGISSDHKDLVYHASQLSAAPVGGTISVDHKHALSKIHLYAATGTNTAHIANVELVEIDSQGTVTISPLSSNTTSTETGISWINSDSTYASYQYFYIANSSATAFNSTTYGSNPIINKEEDAPLMIIPQETTAATISAYTDSSVILTGSYVRVIYYLTDSNGDAVVGYSSVEKHPDADDYIEADQTKVLYVMGAFPLCYEFEPNKVYDLTLGLGSTGSTGGILITDYYVDKDGNPVTLTKEDDDDETYVEVPGIDEGDDILPGDDDIDITVSASDWESGDTVTVL